MRDNKNYVSYYRVSTEKQGLSGLGLQAQKDSVMAFIDQNGDLKGQFTDVESGANNERAGLRDAIAAAVRHNATIVVKELSRITRSGYKVLADLEELGINYIESNSPHDSQLLKEIKITLAKDERLKIITRTKDALQVIKDELKENGCYTTKAGANITSLGNIGFLDDRARQKSVLSRKAKAKNNPNTIKAKAFAESLLQNKMSRYKIAKVLNDNGFKTPRGGNFSVTQVSRLINQ